MITDLACSNTGNYDRSFQKMLWSWSWLTDQTIEAFTIWSASVVLSDDTLQKLVLLRMNKKYMEYRRTREPLLARRLLLDKVRAGQEKAALEEAAAARDAGAGGAGGSAAADAMVM